MQVYFDARPGCLHPEIDLSEIAPRLAAIDPALLATARKLEAALQQRVETLEAIATDPAERTAREIEGLRTLPLSKSGSSD